MIHKKVIIRDERTGRAKVILIFFLFSQKIIRFNLRVSLKKKKRWVKGRKIFSLKWSEERKLSLNQCVEYP